MSGRLSPFEAALVEESRWLAIIVNQPFPLDGLTTRRVYIGPCFQPRWRHEMEGLGSGWRRDAPDAGDDTDAHAKAEDAPNGPAPHRTDAQ